MGDVPAVCELCADVFEIVVAHVLDGEDENVLVFVCCFPHGGEESLGELFAFLFDFGEVHCLGAL